MFVAKSTRERPLSDKLVWTSAIYGMAGLYSLSVGQHYLGIGQFIT